MTRNIKIFLTWIVFACEGSAVELTNPTELQSVVAIERSLAVIFVDQGTIYQLPDYKSYFIATPFKPEAKTREEVFGEPTSSNKVEIGAEGEPKRPWRGGAVVGDVVLLLDGVTLELIAYSRKTNAFLSRHSIVWDRLKPARDRGGEAGTPETAAFRKRFFKAMGKADSAKFVGMAVVPEKWRESKETEFFLSTRIVGFPLLIMSCTKDDLSRCQVRRGCSVENLKSKADDLVGIGVIESGRQLLIGDRKLHAINALKFNSCLDVRKQAEVILPKRVFEVTNLHVENDVRLWVTTIRPDDYFNATAFFWDVPAKL